MKTLWMSAVVLLTGLASPLLAADDLGEAKPFVKLSEGKPASKAQVVSAAEGKPRLTEPIDYLDFVFVASDRPVLLRLHLRNNRKSYSVAWDAYMKKLHAYLDKNGDGVLDKAEIERAPSVQFLVFHLSGALGSAGQEAKGQLGRFDSNKDGKVSLAEFKAFYRKGGFSALQFFNNNNRAAVDIVTNVIYKRLDCNKDGKLSAQEMTRTEAALLRFDLDENEMLTAAELRPGGEDNQFFGRPIDFGQSGPNADMGFLEIKPETGDSVGRQVLAHYDKDKNGKLSQAESGLDKPLFDRLDANHDSQLDAKEFAGFFRRDADLELIARTGQMQEKVNAVVNLVRKVGVPLLPAVRTEVYNPDRRAMPLADAVRRNGPSALAFSLGDAKIGLSASDQQFGPYGQFPRRFYEDQFRQADTGKKGVVDRKQAMSAQFLSSIFDLVDRNGDGKLTQKELKAYLDMQTEGSGCRLELTITDEGRSLFDLLDADGDGRLSLREMRSAWSRMKTLAKSDNGLSRQDIPRRLDVSIGQAQGRFRQVVVFGEAADARGLRAKAAPLWFQKMDRNQDGDISPREFLGRDEDFHKLDADGDGLISTAEAWQLEERLKKEKDKKR